MSSVGFGHQSAAKQPDLHREMRRWARGATSELLKHTVADLRDSRIPPAAIAWLSAFEELRARGEDNPHLDHFGH